MSANTTEARSILRSVDWAEEADGRVIPTANFDPVMLGWKTVKQIRLADYATVDEIGAWIGDAIVVRQDGTGPISIEALNAEHDSRAQPVLDPLGWPVGAGHPDYVGRSADRQKRSIYANVNLRPRVDDVAALVTTFTGDPENRTEGEDEDYYEHEAYVSSPEPGDDIRTDLYTAFDQGGDELELVPWVMRWMQRRLHEYDFDLQYQRFGRDLITKERLQVERERANALVSSVVREPDLDLDDDPAQERFPAPTAPAPTQHEALVAKLDRAHRMSSSDPDDPAASTYYSQARDAIRELLSERAFEYAVGNPSTGFLSEWLDSEEQVRSWMVRPGDELLRRTKAGSPERLERVDDNDLAAPDAERARLLASFRALDRAEAAAHQLALDLGERRSDAAARCRELGVDL